MNRFVKTVVGGLAIVLPLVVTLWVATWFVGGAENVLGGLLKDILGYGPPFFDETHAGWFEKWGWLDGHYYVPGMGIVLGIVLAVLVGLVARAWLFRGLILWFEHLISQIPLLKTLYSGVKDMLGFVGGKSRPFSRVVLVKVPNTNFQMLGFVTRDSLAEIRGLEHKKDHLAVYISLSYNVGGYTMLVPRENIEETHMRVEDALRFALTAGVSVEEEKAPPKA